MGENGDWHVVVIVQEDAGTVIVLSLAPLAAGEDRLIQAMEAVVRSNFGLSVGAFDLDLDSGAVQFRTAVDVQGEPQALTTGVIRHLLYQNVVTMDRFLPILRVALEGDNGI